MGGSGYTIGMDKQQTFTDMEYARRKRVSRREAFLEEMNRLAPKGAVRNRERGLYKEPVNRLEYIGQPDWEGEIEYMKSKVRSKVEHIFYIVKRLFGYRKAVYRGLAKNTARLYLLFASANLLKWAWPMRPYERPASA
jgi:hypothetical protein